jgi:hypothetical protein
LKRQNIISCLSTKLEYHAMVKDMEEACWLHQLLVELYNPLSQAILVYCDNVIIVYLSTNPVQHQNNKHVEIDLHFVREWVAIGNILVLDILTISQFANIFTKRLFSSVFLEF